MKMNKTWVWQVECSCDKMHIKSAVILKGKLSSAIRVEGLTLEKLFELGLKCMYAFWFNFSFLNAHSSSQSTYTFKNRGFFSSWSWKCSQEELWTNIDNAELLLCCCHFLLFSLTEKRVAGVNSETQQHSCIRKMKY